MLNDKCPIYLKIISDSQSGVYVYMDSDVINVNNRKGNMNAHRCTERVGRPSYAGMIAEWRERHPEGSPVECARELGISRATAYRRWASCGTPLKSLSERVGEWRKSNPSGRICDCVRELKASRSRVSEVWNH